MKWENKICIGVPQFSGNYGITNKDKKKFKSEELKTFFYHLRKNKINFIDTALSYKKAEESIFSSKIDTSKMEIITKIPKPNKKINYEKFILKEITKSKKKFKIKRFNTILLHNCNRINKSEILEVLGIFKILKQKNLTKYVGFSIYNLKEYNKIIKFFTPDILQVPANVFDRTFLKKSFLDNIKKKKIKLHIRSIFLQGLILANTQLIRKRFIKWEDIFHKWHKYCISKKTSKIDLATNFILSFSSINRIVVGFYNKNELIEFLKIKKRKVKLPNFVKNNKKGIEKLIKPYEWNI